MNEDASYYRKWTNQIREQYDIQKCRDQGIEWIEFKSMALSWCRQQVKLDTPLDKINPCELIIPKKELVRKRYPKILKVNDYIGNTKLFHKRYNFFYDNNKIWWVWDRYNYYWKIVDEIDMMNSINDELIIDGDTVSNKHKFAYLEAFKRIGRKNIPKEAKIKWVQFKDKAFSIFSGNVHYITSDYFFTNPIPHEIGVTADTPVMDKLFKEWVGEKHVETLYEIIAYCCYSGYPIQLLFCLVGSGRNGKSQFLKVLEKFIGGNNTTTTELDMLMNNRFESFKLYKKLLALMGETNFGVLDKSSILKKVTGGDKIGFEKKNKDPFDDYNYAKILIASNSLPSSNDTSDGFFRRWMIIDFPNEFEDVGKEVWETIPDHEYENLAKKVTLILPRLLNKGRFSNQGTIEERRKKYISVSNPLSLFLDQYCKKDEDEFILYSRLYTYYVKYLAMNKRRRVKRKEFKSALEDEGLFVEKDNINIDGEYKSGYYVKGVNVLDKKDILDVYPTQLYTPIDLSENVVQNVQNVQKEELVK